MDNVKLMNELLDEMFQPSTSTPTAAGLRRLAQEVIERFVAKQEAASKVSDERRAELQKEWTEQFGDHSECSVCGTACEMMFVEGR
jgi:hypothetical protein